jgi:hypothetical protein
LLSGEIDVDLRIMRLAIAGDGTFLFVLWRGHGVWRRTRDHGVSGFEAQTIGESVIGVGREDIWRADSQFFWRAAD